MHIPVSLTIPASADCMTPVDSTMALAHGKMSMPCCLDDGPVNTSTQTFMTAAWSLQVCLAEEMGQAGKMS